MRAEGVQDRHRAVRRPAEDHTTALAAVAARAAARRGRPVETARRVHRQRTVGCGAVRPTGEGVQHAQLARGREHVDRAASPVRAFLVVRRRGPVRGAVEIARRVAHHAVVRREEAITALAAARVESVERREPGRRKLEDRAAAAAAACHRRAVETARRILDESAEGQGAVAALEFVQRDLRARISIDRAAALAARGGVAAVRRDAVELVVHILDGPRAGIDAAQVVERVQGNLAMRVLEKRALTEDAAGRRHAVEPAVAVHRKPAPRRTAVVEQAPEGMDDRLALLLADALRQAEEGACAVRAAELGLAVEVALAVHHERSHRLGAVRAALEAVERVIALRLRAARADRERHADDQSRFLERHPTNSFSSAPLPRADLENRAVAVIPRGAAVPTRRTVEIARRVDREPSHRPYAVAKVAPDRVEAVQRTERAVARDLEYRAGIARAEARSGAVEIRSEEHT